MNQIIILAGGKGKRMGGEYPKTLTEINGKPIIFRILDGVEKICPQPTLVVGFGAEKVMAAVGERVEYAMQEVQLGTGHAVLCAREKLNNDAIKKIIVIPGDHPLVNGDSILDLISQHEESNAQISLSFVRVPSFEGDFDVFYHYGRILRDEKGEVRGIGELKDIGEDQKKIKEVNVGYYCFDAKWLWENIDSLGNENAAKEFYLTDLIGIAVGQNAKIGSYQIENLHEGMGVNTPEQKRMIEDILEKL